MTGCVLNKKNTTKESFSKKSTSSLKSFSYQGRVVNAENKGLNGVFSIEAKLLDSSTTAQLSRQFFDKISFNDGLFELNIDIENSLSNLKSTKVLLDIQIDGKQYQPQIGLFPITHRLQVFSNNFSAANIKTDFTVADQSLLQDLISVQAVTLRPISNSLERNSSKNKKIHPYTLDMYGPVISVAVSLLDEVENVTMPFVVNNKKKNTNKSFDENNRRFGTGTLKINDELASLSKLNSGTTGLTPMASINFEGLSSVSGSFPPDVAGVVGKNHYIQMVNHVFAIYDKNENMLAGPINTKDLWQGFGGFCESNNDGDAIALYDQQADRYVLSQFVTRGAQSVCFAVSTSPDPLGSYYLYELPTQRLPDYYKLGVWADKHNNAYFMGTNSGLPNAYDVYAIDRESLLNGSVPRKAQFFQNFSNLLLPADQDGNLSSPIGSPGLFYSFVDGGEEYFGDPAPLNDSIDLYAFSVNWGLPSQSTIELVQSFAPPDIADFNWTVCGLFARSCLEQPNTITKIDSGSWWPMQRFQYRNFGTYEMLLGSWTVDALADGDHAAPRWFELRKIEGGQWQIYQQGTYAPDSSHRWMSSIAMNGMGDIGMVYNILDATNNIMPGIRYTSRKSTDTLGLMRTESVLQEATGVQTSTFRWGDYSSMNIDPVDECRFWFSAEYIQTTDDASWQTRIGSFNFPGCVSVVPKNANQELCVADDSIDFDFRLTGDFDATTNLMFSHCPTGASCSFSVDPVINPNDSSQLQVSGLSSGTPAGDYQITITATDSIIPDLTYDAVVALSLVDGLPGASSLSEPEDTDSFISTFSRQFSWTEVSNTSSYLFELATDNAFTNIVESTNVNETGYISQVNLSPETLYYWRVTTANLCGAGVVSDVFSFTTAPLPGKCLAGDIKTTVSNYDFEDGVQGWSSASLIGANSWNLSTTNGSTGVQHWHIDDIASETDTTLTSPKIDLPLVQKLLTLHFNNYQNMESNGENSCWDGGIVEISTDGGINFEQILNDNLLTDSYDGPFQSNSLLAGQNGWCGNPQAYLESIINLNAYAGQSVQLRFRLVTDSNTGDEGWDIDDVSIQSCVGGQGLIFNNGFENK
jgi:hypothetical protein